MVSATQLGKDKVNGQDTPDLYKPAGQVPNSSPLDLEIWTASTNLCTWGQALIKLLQNPSGWRATQ
eukprot:3286664-Rhodomonas_salina.1